MSTIAWNESVPSGTSVVEPTIARSVWSSLAVGLSEVVYWPGSGGGSVASAGEVRPGRSLAFYGPQSASSNPTLDHVSRAYLASDTSRLFVYGSGQTFLAGSPRVWEHNLRYTSPNYTWVVQRSATTGLDGTLTTKAISFPTPYTGAPEVFTSSSATSYIHGVSNITSGGFISEYSYIPVAAEAGSNFTLYWYSVGTMPFGGQG